MMDFRPLIDWLSYKSYEHNRFNNPDIPYYKWRLLFTEAVLFEEIYDRNLKRIYKGE